MMDPTDNMDPSQNMEIDTLRDDPLLGLGLLHIEDPEEDNVSSILMKNGSRMKRAKRSEQMVSVGNLSWLPWQVLRGIT